MDAALIAVSEREWGGKVAAPHSRAVGVRPIQIVTGSRLIDADITEHQGYADATIPGEPLKEPLMAVYAMLNRIADPGDSGCLIVDTVSNKRTPYLLYLGAYGTKSRELGVGLLLEQVNITWGIECFTNGSTRSRK
jgi:hypothetical protein